MVYVFVFLLFEFLASSYYIHESFMKPSFLNMVLAIVFGLLSFYDLRTLLLKRKRADS